MYDYILQQLIMLLIWKNYENLLRLVAGDLVQVPSAKNSTLGYFTVGIPISSFSNFHAFFLKCTIFPHYSVSLPIQFDNSNRGMYAEQTLAGCLGQMIRYKMCCT